MYAEYAVITPQGQIHNIFWVEPSTTTMKPGYSLRPVERSIGVLGANQYHVEVTTILPDKVTIIQTPTNKTPTEIDTDKEATLNNFDVLIFKVLFDHENRIRVLESKAAITSAQFRAALKVRL